MSSPKILLRDADTESRRAVRLAPAPDFGWALIGIAGIALVIVGGLDLLLAWIPLNMGNPEWEFGTITAVMNGMPVLTMGLVFLLGSGVATGRRWLVRTSAAAFLLLALSIVAAALLYATTVPMALGAVDNPVIKMGLKKAMAKTAGQAVVYPVVFVLIAIKGWRHVAART